MSEHEWADPDEHRWLREAAAKRAADDALGERVEVERAAGRWAGRLCAARGHVVVLRTSDGVTHEGVLLDTGEGWAVLGAQGRARLVMLAAVVSVAAPGGGALGPVPRVPRGVGSVYRRWARLAASIVLALQDGSQLRGAVTEVLADAVTLDPEAAGNVTVPFSAVRWAVGAPLSDD
jgi:hypothetical protein